MPAMVMLHEEDPKQVILDAVGEIPKGVIFKNQVLCAVYERPAKTRSGIILADVTKDEDQFQGKVCLVVALGPDAFVDTGEWHFKEKAEVGDWVWFRTSDSLAFRLNGKLCRAVYDTDIRGRLPHPDLVW
jgi:co-chaperonin GroES (HSP10)